MTGKELWRLNVKKTECYSMDVDGSALVVNDTAYIGLENGLFVALDPDKKKFDSINSTSSPDIINQLYLYTEQDKILHGKDLVTESSPCLLGNHIYITCGSGHVYGYNLTKKEIDWDLYLAADLNGSPVVTSDSCLLVTIEKQYIPGSGGVIKLNPALPPDKSIVWFFPTLDKRFGQWHGGIIGSVAVNDKYKCDSSISLCGFSAIDGYLYIINHKSLEPKKLVTGPNNKKQFPTPKLLYKYYIGASISTPIIVNNRIIAAGYGGIYIFEFNNQMKFTLLDRKPGIFESTPIADDNKIFIASRDGYLYCFGDKNDTGSSAQSDIKILADLKAITSISDSKPKEITINASNIETSSDKVLEKHPKEEKTVTKPSGVIPVQGKADKTQKYKIVAGSFKTAAQAETFNAILISRGFDSEIMGPKNKFYYNIINSFPTLNEAYQEIIRIREGGTSQVWVLEY
ncbi:MAG: PQQ-binding-like beta-propeller repeat protein [Bacteroidia bacterium]|nr:PQQ-binding-like beta-propeller repeat protein [Bacteroidia bacterium]